MNDSERLYKKLIEYSRSGEYPFHMPGHKRRLLSMENPYSFDMTEIDGFDNLHEAEGVLKEEQSRAARLYGAGETHFMVNGSTGGLLAAIAGILRRGERVLVARNCHTSVYHGLELNGLRPVYLWPEVDKDFGIYQGISGEMTAAALDEYSDIRAVICTSPTYEGLLSDIRGICEAAHSRGIPCIVDEAHGAHLRWAGIEDSLSAGADVVVQSLHKTMPCLTQTALLHLQGQHISREAVRRMLACYQTSSPSYVLMASISQCMDWIEAEGREAFDEYKNRIAALRKELAKLKHLYIYTPEGQFDWGKLVIGTGTSGMTGGELYRILKDVYGLTMEMASDGYVLAMTTVADDAGGLKRLTEALFEIDRKMPEYKDRPKTGKLYNWPRPQRRMEIHEAVQGSVRSRELELCAGHVAGDYIYLYPPGIPILVPGEMIQMEHIKQMENYLSQGLSIHGGFDSGEKRLSVVDGIRNL